MRYSSQERDLLGIVWALEQWRLEMWQERKGKKWDWERKGKVQFSFLSCSSKF